METNNHVELPILFIDTPEKRYQSNEHNCALYSRGLFIERNEQPITPFIYGQILAECIKRVDEPESFFEIVIYDALNDDSINKIGVFMYQPSGEALLSLQTHLI